MNYMFSNELSNKVYVGKVRSVEDLGYNVLLLDASNRISAFDTKNSNFPQFGIASPFSYSTQLGMSTFKKGLNPDDYQGLISL